jgi:L-2-aminoadipate reductase
LTVTNTDDFLWRLVKGCIQLGLVPDMNNTVNMVPVNHVARCTVLAALAPLPDSAMQVLHVQARPLPTYNDMFRALEHYGFATAQCDYLVWRRRLEQHIMDAQDNALFPLLHFVLDDLPTSTKSPNLDDTNMRAVLRSDESALKDEMTVTDEVMGKYLAWLVQAGFLPPPLAAGAVSLPTLSQEVTTRAVGRSGGAA